VVEERLSGSAIMESDERVVSCARQDVAFGDDNSNLELPGDRMFLKEAKGKPASVKASVILKCRAR
jgi:hypothetical protein